MYKSFMSHGGNADVPRWTDKNCTCMDVPIMYWDGRTKLVHPIGIPWTSYVHWVLAGTHIYFKIYSLQAYNAIHKIAICL